MKNIGKMIIAILVLLALIVGIVFMIKGGKGKEPEIVPVPTEPVEEADPNAPPVEEYLNPVVDKYVPRNDEAPVVVKKDSEVKAGESIELTLEESEPTWAAKAFRELKAKEISIQNNTDKPLDYKIVFKNVDTNIANEELRIFIPNYGEMMVYEGNAIMAGRVYPGETTEVFPVFSYIDYYVFRYIEEGKSGYYVKYDLDVVTEEPEFSKHPFENNFVSYENGNLLFDGLIYELSSGTVYNIENSAKVKIDGQEYTVYEQGTYSGNDYIYNIDLAPGTHTMEATVNGYTYKGYITIPN